MRSSCFLLVLVLALAAVAADEEFLGKWDLTVSLEGGDGYTSWLELTREGGTLKARFVGRGGSVFPVPDVAIENGELIFKTFSGREPRVATVYRARMENKKLEGAVATGDAAPRHWTGVRAPDWKTPKMAAAKKKPGKPVALFNGQDVTGWLGQDKSKPLGWAVKDGALDNQGKANNIYSEQKFSDFKLEVEFNVAAHSNSGVYLRGRHEIQVLDDAGKPPESHGNGALYGFLTPSVNASKPPGEWQKLEATLVGNRVTIILNGTKIIDDEEIPGVTGGALDSRESDPGPIMLQGDHGPVQYRKVVVTPLR